MAERSLEIGNLPAGTVQLVGREELLAELLRRSARHRLVTLSGPGGVGKTRLARRAAAELGPDFPDGVWWVELSQLEDGAMLAYAIAEALPLVDQGAGPMWATVAAYLAERRLLLVLDTCEHVAEECAEAVAELLAAAPGLRVLATSRRALGLPEEDVLPVDPLPEADAFALLALRTGQSVPALAAADGGAALRLCRRLEGLPLAVELAAARLRQMPIAELNRRLDDRFSILGETRQAVYGVDPPWHQALLTAIGWSHQLCTPAERLAWARLSVFAGSFDAGAACRVLADDQLSAEQVPAILAALVESSIVTWEPTGAGERYRMLDTIREFGTHWLRSLGEEKELRRRHRDVFLHLARRGDRDWLGPGQPDWYERTAAEHANLRAALDFCLAEGDARTALDLGGSLWFFWFACGFAREGRHYLERALDLDLDPVPGPERAKALWACAAAAVTQGDAEGCLQLVEQFRAAESAGEDESARVAAAYLEGSSLTVRGRQTRAAEVLDAALCFLPRPCGGRYRAAWFLARAARAFVHVHLREFAEAEAVAEELSAECARRGEVWARAWGDYMRALAVLGLGRAVSAAAHARTALEGKRRLHDSLGIAMAVDLLASASVGSGEAERAARLLGLAEQIWHTLGTPQMGMPELIAARRACETGARELIGGEAFRAAFQTGYTADPGTALTALSSLSG